MGKQDEGKSEEKISFSKEEVANLVKAAVTSAFEALKAPAIDDSKVKELDATSGMTEKEKEEFRLSFGGGQCSECRQPSIRGRYACKGKHTKMVVYPSDPFWGKYFQGVCIGGAWYLSGPGEQITVPEENNIEYEVQKWMVMERENAQGRDKRHNSGTLSGKGNNNTHSFNEPGWR